MCWCGETRRETYFQAELDQDAEEALKPEEEEAANAIEEVKQLRHAILHLARAVESKYLQPPLGMHTGLPFCVLLLMFHLPLAKHCPCIPFCSTFVSSVPPC